MPKESRSDAPRFLIIIMYNLLTIRNVCERLFEELVKELLKDRFTVVSGSFREIDGRKVRVMKAHLRKRKR